MAHPGRATKRSTCLSRQIDAAQFRAQALLAAAADRPALAALRQHVEVLPLLAQLRLDAEVLGAASARRISAARRLQGAAVHRAAVAAKLFATCNEIRRRVRARYRGPAHSELRRAVGEGIAANPAKPQGVVAFAEQVIAAAEVHGEALRAVRVGPPTLCRLKPLVALLRGGTPERLALRRARRQVSEGLHSVAVRIAVTCEALIAVVALLGGAGEADGLRRAMRPPRRTRVQAAAPLQDSRSER